MYWQIYLSSAPRICAPTPVNLGPYWITSQGVSFPRNTGFSTEYMKQKVCFLSGIETLKYHPSKNFRVLPSKWYLSHCEIISHQIPSIFPFFSTTSITERQMNSDDNRNSETENELPAVRRSEVAIPRRRRVNRADGGGRSLFIGTNFRDGICNRSSDIRSRTELATVELGPNRSVLGRTAEVDTRSGFWGGKP